jgi:molecular chaperone DnaK (HSP70)
MSNQQQQIQQGAVGIDLGSWRSVIAVAKRGGVEIITNEANFRETPSVVGYGPNERFIGEAGNVKVSNHYYVDENKLQGHSILSHKVLGTT